MQDLSDAIFFFAHGAGLGMDSEFMSKLAERLLEKGVTTKRFEFPYMQLIREEGKKKAPR